MMIRQATLQDVPAILHLIGEVIPIMIAADNLQWDNNYPNAQVFENDIQLNQLWVAEVEQTVAGVAAFTTDAEPEYAGAGIDTNLPAIVTHRLAVSPRYQGMGIASALLKQAEKVAKAKE